MSGSIAPKPGDCRYVAGGDLQTWTGSQWLTLSGVQSVHVFAAEPMARVEFSSMLVVSADLAQREQTTGASKAS